MFDETCICDFYTLNIISKIVISCYA